MMKSKALVALIHFIFPVLVLFLWLKPDWATFTLVFSQLLAMFVFYSPFLFIARFILFRFAPQFNSFVFALSLVFAGLFSILVINLSLPQAYAWFGLLLVSLPLISLNLKRLGPTTQLNGGWLCFSGLLVINLFAVSKTSSFFPLSSKEVSEVYTSWIGPFYPQTSCDASLVHLILPKIYSAHGGWINAWWTRGPYSPILISSQFALEFSIMKKVGLRADLIPTISEIYFLFTLIFTSTLLLGKRLRWWFGSALLCFSLTRFNLSSPYMDLPVTVMILGTLGALLTSYDSASLSTGLLTGLFTAAGVGIKLFSLFYVVPLGLIWMILRWKKKIPLKWFIGFFAGFLAVFFICYFRNWQLSGNPIFPFLVPMNPQVFHWDLKSLKSLDWAIHHWLTDPTITGLLKSFWQICFDQSKYTDTYGFIYSFLAPFSLIIILISAVSLRSIRKPAALTFVVFFIQYITWYFSSPVIRYLFPLFCLLTLATVYFADLTKSKSIRNLYLCFLMIIFLHSQWPWIQSRPELPPVEWSDVKTFYRNNTHHYKAFEWLDSQTPINALVYSYGGACEKLQNPRAHAGDWFGDLAYETFHQGTIDEVRNFILKNHFDYITEEWGDLRRLESLPLSQICLKEVDFNSKYVKIFERLHTPECAFQGSPDILETIPFQPKGLDFFFRKQ